jgi:hypothetical protein
MDCGSFRTSSHCGKPCFPAYQFGLVEHSPPFLHASSLPRLGGPRRALWEPRDTRSTSARPERRPRWSPVDAAPAQPASTRRPTTAAASQDAREGCGSSSTSSLRRCYADSKGTFLVWPKRDVIIVARQSSPNRLTREPTCDYMGKRGSANTRKRVELVCMNAVLSQGQAKGDRCLFQKEKRT